MLSLSNEVSMSEAPFTSVCENNGNKSMFIIITLTTIIPLIAQEKNPITNLMRHILVKSNVAMHRVIRTGIEYFRMISSGTAGKFGESEMLLLLSCLSLDQSLPRVFYSYQPMVTAM